MIGQVYNLKFQMEDDGELSVEINIDITVDHNKTITVDEISEKVNQIAMELDGELKSIMKQ